MLTNKSILLIVKLLLVNIFFFTANIEAKFLYRIDLLIHNFDGYIGVIVFISLWLTCYFSLIATAFIQNKYSRIILALIIFGFSLTGLSYEIASGAYLTYDNLAIMSEAVDYVSDAFIFYFQSILISFFICVIGVVGILIPPSKLKNESGFRKLFLAFKRVFEYPFVLLPFVIIFILSMIRGGGGTDGLPIQYKTASLFAHIKASQFFSPDIVRSNVKIPNFQDARSSKNIILIVDESVRGDFLDINYMRGTTPNLLSQESSISNFGLAVSGANCSSGSNQILRTGAQPSSFQETLMRNPFVWDYAKAAGYNTVYIDAQAKKGRLNNRMTLDEKSKINEFIYSEGISRYKRDLNAISIIKEKIQSDEPNFIYLVKSGIHFPYESSYPPEQGEFKPHMEGGHVINSKQLMINSYKNAISFSTDGFFKYLFEELDFSETVLIYTADHGQNLMDNGVQLTHCSTENASNYEALVPLFAVTGDVNFQGLFERFSQENFNKTSHFNIYPTLLLLFGYDATITNKTHGETLFSNLNLERSFISGVVSEYRLSLGKHSELRLNDVQPQFINSVNDASVGAMKKTIPISPY